MMIFPSYFEDLGVNILYHMVLKADFSERKGGYLMRVYAHTEPLEKMILMSFEKNKS